MKVSVVGLLCVVCGVDFVYGHGRLLNPPSRSSMWRAGFNTPPNYNDNQLFCGGFENQTKNGGKCGICGDDYAGPRENEAGGKYANGIIVKDYTEGATMQVTVKITANHLGWMEFRLCPNNNVNLAATQECLDNNLLQMVNGSTRYYIGKTSGNITLDLKLPPGLTCTQCVLQWKYHTGNSWGVDPDGTKGLGYGPQEEFYGCADIAINAANDNGTNGKNVPNQTTSDPPNTSTMRSKVTTQAYEDTTQGKQQAVNGSHKKCQANGLYKLVPGISTWCNNNCNHVPSFCPESHCLCL